MKVKKFSIIIVLLAAMALFAGAVSAQEDTPDAASDGNTRQRIIGLIAEQIDMTPREVLQQMQSGATLQDILAAAGTDIDTVLESAVQQGIIDAEQAVRLATLLANNFQRPDGEQGQRVIVTLIANALDIEPLEIARQLRAGATLQEILEANGLDAEAVIAAGVADGIITAEQGESLLNRLNRERPNFTIAGALLSAASEATGLTQREIAQQVRDGMTLADVLTANGVDPNTVIDMVLVDVEAQLTELMNTVPDGRFRSPPDVEPGS